MLKRSSFYQVADITVILTGTNVSLRIETRCRHLSANKPSFLRPVKLFAYQEHVFAGMRIDESRPRQFKYLRVMWK
jgi:hypothetical protein